MSIECPGGDSVFAREWGPVLEVRIEVTHQEKRPPVLTTPRAVGWVTPGAMHQTRQDRARWARFPVGKLAYPPRLAQPLSSEPHYHRGSIDGVHNCLLPSAVRTNRVRPGALAWHLGLRPRPRHERLRLRPD